MIWVVLALAGAIGASSFAAQRGPAASPVSPTSPAVAAARDKPAPAALDSLADAFKDGQVGLAAWVIPGTGDGRTVRLGIRNKAASRLRIIIPPDATVLDRGEPIGTVHLRFATRRTLTLAPDATANPVDLAQTGTRRESDGTFWLGMADGRPTFRGSVTTGTVTP